MADASRSAFLQRPEPDLIQRFEILLQLRRREGLAVRGTEQTRRALEHRFPRALELRQVFDPDGRASAAGEAVHGRVAAKQHIPDKQRDMVRGVAGRFRGGGNSRGRRRPRGIRRGRARSFSGLSVPYSTISRVPAPIKAQPRSDFAVKSSCRNTKANTSVMMTLSLSTGTTLEASPICSAL